MQKLDLSKEYAVVLEGGGARGAYQIGAWKALKEAGVKIRAVSGVSVGALNGALIAMDDYALAERLWENLTYSQVIDVDDNIMAKLLAKEFREIGFQEFRKSSKEFLTKHGFDITPLKRMLEQYIDIEKVMNASTDLFITTFSLKNMKEEAVSNRTIRAEELLGYLVASSNLPVFRQEKINGKLYIDGGIVNSVPIDILLKQGYRDIIVIRLYGFGVEKRVKLPEDANVYEIAPREDLGSILEFDGKRAKKNMCIGYYDALRLLKGLDGKRYYLDGIPDEKTCAEFLMRYATIAREAFLEMPEAGTGYASPYREAVESIYPKLAAVKKLGKNWTYKDIYTEMFEVSFEKLQMERYRIYSIDEMNQVLAEAHAWALAQDKKNKLSAADNALMNLSWTGAVWNTPQNGWNKKLDSWNNIHYNA